MRTRRALLTMAAPLALGGCSIFSGDFWNDLFETKKDPLPGKRETIAVLQQRSDDVLADQQPVVLPTPPTANASWPQPGGDPTHYMNNLAGPGALNVAWTASIGSGGGYRRMVTAQPLVANGHVFTMDSDGNVRAFAFANGARLWSTDTRPKKDRSTNIGGGISYDSGVLYAATGLGELLALDPASGAIKWRVPVATPARSGPTISGGKLYLPTVDSRMVAYDQGNGKQIWSYDGSIAPTSVLGAPAPAAQGDFVVGGFGGGDVVAIHASTGIAAWQDNLGSVSTGQNITDFSAVRGMPVIAENRVFAVGLGGQTVAFDLPSGRRLWTRTLAGINEPWIAGNMLFMVNTDQQVVALSREDGATRWTADLPHYRNPAKQRDPITWYGPTLCGFHLILLSSNNQMITVNPVTGAVGSTYPLPGAAQVPAVAANGTMLVVTADGTLSAYR